MKKTMTVEGMSCGHCTARVEKALNAIGGVQAEANLQKGEVYVTMENNVEDSVLTGAVEEAGYEVKGIQ